jgi:hypothetical protein
MRLFNREDADAASPRKFVRSQDLATAITPDDAVQVILGYRVLADPHFHEARSGIDAQGFKSLPSAMMAREIPAISRGRSGAILPKIDQVRKSASSSVAPLP